MPRDGDEKVCVLVQCFMTRLPPSENVLIVSVSSEFVFMVCIVLFQFCMDTVKKFCHVGKHALILRAGNRT